MLFEGIILGILTGWLRGGKFSNIEHTNPQRLFLVFISIGIQLALWIGFFQGDNFFGHTATRVLHLLSYLPLIWFVYLNRRSLGLLVIGLGFCMNLAAIAANGGFMPANADCLDPIYRQELYDETYSPFHRAATEETRLYPLADIIRLPYGEHKVISIGDIVITAGLAFFIQNGMLLPKKKENAAG